MDEPTNNLDKISRNILYDYVKSNKKGIIIVSHDRALLSKMDAILEITTKGINLYGGNYNFYQDQKNIELKVLEKDYLSAKNELEKEKRQAQINREKAEKRQSQGKQLRHSNSQSKMILDYMKSNSEKSLSKMATKNDRLLSDTQNSLESAKEKIEFKNTITASLDTTVVPNGKTVLKIQEFCFKYPNQTEFLIDRKSVV